VIGAVMSIVLSACGSGGQPAALTTTTTGPVAAGPAFQPAAPSKADRTIVIQALDTLRFDPAAVDIRSGETVTFKVDNVSAVAHEFDVGDAAFQTQHEQEMRAMPSDMVMKDEPTAITLAPGQTKELTFTFFRPAALLYGCHMAGHYAAGMKGEITVT
jgi:uncharacterized cupredoxin-like copper-binding protein